VSHLVPDAAVPDEFWEVLGADPNDPPVETEHTPLWRAVRLWQVDYDSAKEDSLQISLGMYTHYQYYFQYCCCYLFQPLLLL
jgi:hypothetical protein